MRTSLKASVLEEIKRSPLTAISGVAAVVVAVLSLMVAWLQFRGTVPTVSATPSGNAVPIDLAVGNVFLLIAYFLAITVAASVALRVIARNHDITALFASIPLMALTNFTVILLMYLAPPRPMTRQLFTSAHDLVFYASAAIVIAICGKAVLADLASTVTSKKSQTDKPSGNDGTGWFFIALILLALWSWLVFAGQTRLTRTLLPEITHPLDVKASATEAPNSTVDRDAKLPSI